MTNRRQAPHKTSYQTRVAKAGPKDPPPTRIITFNATAWSSAKAFVLGEEHGAAVICIQEHHLVFDQSIATEQASLQAAGWRGFFAPATQTPGALRESHSSGGVAVLVREEFSAHHAAVILPGRGIGV